jgi:hypothetical protein
MENHTPPPTKRRRFFEPDPSEVLTDQSPSSLNTIPAIAIVDRTLDSATPSPSKHKTALLAESHQTIQENQQSESRTNGTSFDRELFQSMIAAQLEDRELAEIERFAEGDIERGMS